MPCRLKILVVFLRLISDIIGLRNFGRINIYIYIYIYIDIYICSEMFKAVFIAILDNVNFKTGTNFTARNRRKNQDIYLTIFVLDEEGGTLRTYHIPIKRYA